MNQTRPDNIGPKHSFFPSYYISYGAHTILFILIDVSMYLYNNLQWQYKSQKQLMYIYNNTYIHQQVLLDYRIMFLQFTMAGIHDYSNLRRLKKYLVCNNKIFITNVTLKSLDQWFSTHLRWQTYFVMPYYVSMIKFH